MANLSASFIKQGWSPEQAAILAIAAPETERVLAEMPVREDAPERSKLIELAEKYEATFRSIHYKAGGSRARTAIDIVLRGAMRRLSKPGDAIDEWVVDGVRCSKKGKACDCKDIGTYSDEKYGRLCAHRLAIIMADNVVVGVNTALTAYLKVVIEAANGRYFDLLVTRDHVYQSFSDQQAATVAGYWAFGMSQHLRLDPKSEISFTLPQMQRAMDELGLALVELPMKLPGFTDYYYRMAVSTDGLMLDELTFWHKGQTWAMEHRERSRRIDLMNLAMYLDQWKNGPISITLSGHESRRVVELHHRLIEGGVPVGEAWAELPEAMKLEVLRTEILWERN